MEWLFGVTAGVVTVAGVAVGTSLGKITHATTRQEVVAWVSAAVVVIAGTLTVRFVATALHRLLTRRSSPGAGATLRLVATGVGYVIVLFALLAVLGVSVKQLLIGAGLAGVILGIAAQQSLSNVFASIVLLFARPFVVGDDIRVRSGVVGVLDVTVLGIGLTYVTVRTDDGVLKIPNSVILASGIGKPHRPARPASTAPTEKAPE